MTFGDFLPNPIYVESLLHLLASTRNFWRLFFSSSSLSLSHREISHALFLSLGRRPLSTPLASPSSPRVSIAASLIHRLLRRYRSAMGDSQVTVESLCGIT
ncbi:hypothetical protein Scep_005513 [Stephania cephalantha]|uniref:Uncharacterized protein n=1 Tax=Stephania cephalantha TaxID=152367 RepID=A0AAP0KXK3_9MAGN